MKFREFEKLISPQRLLKYRVSCKMNGRRTLRLYRANIRMSQTFFSVLSVFEVVLRNKIDLHYKVQFPSTQGSPEWLVASILPGGIFTINGCQNSFKKIKRAYDDLGINYTHDKLLAELSFGFWKFMFAGKQYQAGGNTLLSIFPSLPARYNQGLIYHKLDRLNAIRNRIAHHEPICFGSGNLIDTTYVRSHFQDIVDLLSYMNIDSKQLLFGIDGVLKSAAYIDTI